ncbi:copper homeostasis protein CutC [Limibacter armeniacum]|uniref:copper homeostasis protein CutC n=1 Tax=Limibacter armeniacum TaxID=466084 RepID=UPI002FE52AA3
MEKKLLEICAYSVESAIAAQSGGADRVELCSGFLEGGTTPSMGAIALARKYLKIQLFPIIRPRGGDFCYSDLEVEQMKADIQNAKELGVDGVVIGLLNDNGRVDKARIKELIDLARPMKVTFHRAFDMCCNPEEALEDLIELGVDRVLTSGQANTVIEGVENIRKLVTQANGRITIMLGSGVTEQNIAQLMMDTDAVEFHSSASITVPSRVKFRNTRINMNKNYTGSEYELHMVGEDKVRAMRSTLDKHHTLF